MSVAIQPSSISCGMRASMLMTRGLSANRSAHSRVAFSSASDRGPLTSSRYSWKSERLYRLSVAEWRVDVLRIVRVLQFAVPGIRNTRAKSDNRSKAQPALRRAQAQ